MNKCMDGNFNGWAKWSFLTLQDSSFQLSYLNPKGWWWVVAAVENTHNTATSAKISLDLGQAWQ